MPERASLRINGNGDIEVELLAGYLTHLDHAYASILVFESVVDRVHRTLRELPSSWYPYPWAAASWPPAPRRGVREVRDWPPTPEQIFSLVQRSEQLVLVGVRLTSPGFWEFIGTANPLEAIRQYLNDRHERRKDREYRESAERRLVALETLKLQNEVISGRIRIAKELGATDRDLAPLLNELVYRPLLALDRYQDKGVIENAERPELMERRLP